MGKLTAEEKKLLEELTARANEPDEEEDFEVWVKNDKGNETRIPGRRAAGWLKENFGITLHDEAPDETPADDEAEEEAAPKDKKPQTDFFGRRKG